jgi:hypothetical protein
LKQRDGGKMPDFTGRATTTADMGKQIALHTNGNYYTSQGKTWTSGRTGQRIRDANDYIKYNDKKSLDDAWAWVQSKGKQVNYRDNFNQLQTAVQIGSFIVEPNTVTRDVSGSNPDTEHGLSVRSVKSLSQWSRKREEQGVAEGSEDLASLRAKANEISNRIDAIVKGGGRVGLDDPLSRQLKAIRSKIQQSKKQGVAEGSVKELQLDLRVLSDEQFQTQYRMTKAEARAELRKSTVKETATAGGTSAGHMSVGAVYKNKPPKMQKPGTNALDSDNLLTGGSLVKRR